MGTRRQARECALQLLYQYELTKGSTSHVSEAFWEEQQADQETRDFAEALVLGVREQLEKIDVVVAEHSAHWKVHRMAAVDKNVLRLGVYELLFCADIPARVTINEAVEIAKRFGTEESGAFVNGILDQVAKQSAQHKV